MSSSTLALGLPNLLDLGIEHRLDMVVGRDFRHPEQRVAIGGPPTPIRRNRSAPSASLAGALINTQMQRCSVDPKLAIGIRILYALDRESCSSFSKCELKVRKDTMTLSKTGEMTVSDDTKEVKRDYNYIPPAQLIMTGLGVSATDLTKDSVKVSTKYLKRLIAKIVSQVHVDDSWYLKNYPDVRGAVMGHDVESARAHFLATGYFEGRLPGNLPFDSDWYYQKYKDIAAVFKRDDIDGLMQHYLSSGYFEGRAGTSADLAAVEEWT
jgi:hypothetical protein